MNTPMTHNEIKELPKGYYPCKEIGRKFRRALLSKRAQFIVNPQGMLEIIYNHHSNSRKLTKGRRDYKQLKYGRLHG